MVGEKCECDCCVMLSFVWVLLGFELICFGGCGDLVQVRDGERDAWEVVVLLFRGV